MSYLTDKEHSVKRTRQKGILNDFGENYIREHAVFIEGRVCPHCCYKEPGTYIYRENDGLRIYLDKEGKWFQEFVQLEGHLALERINTDGSTTVIKESLWK